MKGITLLARILEGEYPNEFPNGYFRDPQDSSLVGGAIVAGSSKRGYGVWKLTDLDDRVVAINSCAYQGHDILGSAEFRILAGLIAGRESFTNLGYMGTRSYIHATTRYSLCQLTLR